MGDLDSISDITMLTIKIPGVSDVDALYEQEQKERTDIINDNNEEDYKNAIDEESKGK